MCLSHSSTRPPPASSARILLGDTARLAVEVLRRSPPNVAIIPSEPPLRIDTEACHAKCGESLTTGVVRLTNTQLGAFAPKPAGTTWLVLFAQGTSSFAACGEGLS